MIYYSKRIIKFTLNMTYGLFCFLERVLHVLALNRLSFGSFGDFLIMVLNGYKGLYEFDEANIKEHAT